MKAAAMLAAIVAVFLGMHAAHGFAVATETADAYKADNNFTAAPPVDPKEIWDACTNAGGTPITGGQLGNWFGCLCPNTQNNPNGTPTIIVFPDPNNPTAVTG
jgi:hypothetical protein